MFAMKIPIHSFETNGPVRVAVAVLMTQGEGRIPEESPLHASKSERRPFATGLSSSRVPMAPGRERIRLKATTRESWS